MRSIASVARWAAYLLVAATMLVVIVACPEGPAGEPGQPGQPGVPGVPADPAGTRPVTIGTIAEQAVVVGTPVTLDVAAYFHDENALTYMASSNTPTVAGASATGSKVTITGVGAGMAMITVTATDPDGLSIKQVFMVMVTVTATEPKPTSPGAECGGPLSTSGQDDLKKECSVTLEDGQHLRSADDSKVMVVHPATESSNVWKLKALDRTDAKGIVVSILDGNRKEVDSITVVVQNSLPTRDPDGSRPPVPGIQLTLNDDDGDWGVDETAVDKPFDGAVKGTYYYKDGVSLVGYFKDTDASDGLVFSRDIITTSSPYIVIRHVESDGSDIYFDVLEEGNSTDRQEFEITAYAKDKAAAKSTDSVTIQYEWPAPREWTYLVSQNVDGGFQFRPVGLRTGVEHMLRFTRHGSKGEAADADNFLFHLIDGVAEELGKIDDGKAVDDSQAVATPFSTVTGASDVVTELGDLSKPAPETCTGTGDSVTGGGQSLYLHIGKAGPLESIGELTLPAGANIGDAVQATLDFTLKRRVPGDAMITFDVRACYRAKDTADLAWHAVAGTSRTLHLGVKYVESGTTEY